MLSSSLTYHLLCHLHLAFITARRLNVRAHLPLSPLTPSQSNSNQLHFLTSDTMRMRSQMGAIAGNTKKKPTTTGEMEHIRSPFRFYLFFVFLSLQTPCFSKRPVPSPEACSQDVPAALPPFVFPIEHR